jgi:Ca2+:H+ antiporter
MSIGSSRTGAIRRLSELGFSKRELIELAAGAGAVVVTAALVFADTPPVLRFSVAAVTLALLARIVGGSTEQLGGRTGAAGAGVIQSALGNLPELFIALFALHKGLVNVVQAALVGSILANSMLVLGLAFIAGGIRHGRQEFHSPYARMLATLTVLAASILSVPTLAHTFHSPAAAHGKALSLICAGVLLAIFGLSLRGLLSDLPGEPEHEPPRWSLRTTIAVLAGAGIAAALVSDWFVNALGPAIHTLHMSEEFAGLVIVAIAGNAVENVVGIQLAARNRPDFAMAIIINSSLQIALALTPALVFASLFFSTSLTLVFPTLLAVSLLFAAGLGTLVVYDGESTWSEGVALVGLYVVLAASFWWGT